MRKIVLVLGFLLASVFTFAQVPLSYQHEFKIDKVYVYQTEAWIIPASPIVMIVDKNTIKINEVDINLTISEFKPVPDSTRYLVHFVNDPEYVIFDLDSSIIAFGSTETGKPLALFHIHDDSIPEPFIPAPDKT